MPADGGGVTVPLSLFSGLVTELSDPDIPEGLSPDNQDVVFLPGSVASRPGVHKVYATPISGNVTVVYQKTYVQPNGQPINLILDSAGNLWKEDVINAPGVLASLGSVPAGSYAQSCSAFGREYIAISDAIHGAGVPLQFDGTNLDRVTQDGPAVGPTIAGTSVPSATIQGISVPVTVNIAAGPNGIVWQDPFFYSFGGGSYWYRDFKVTTTTPHGLTTGQAVTISGSTSTPSVNGSWSAVVTSATTFQVGHGTPVSGAVNGGGGTIGQTSASGTSLSRTANAVLAVTSAAHGFQSGWQVQIAGIANTNIGGGIAAISRDGNGIVTVTTTTAHGLPVGAVIAVAGVTNPDTSYNGTFPVASVTGPTTFTYLQVGTVTTSGAGTGNVQDIWNTTAFIQSVPSTTSFTYQQLGADDTTTGTGTATILGQISPGIHKCVVMFLTRQGYLTAPSVPVQFDANGTQQITVSNLPIGPANVVARVLGFTGAGGSNYFTLLTTPLAAGQAVGTSLVVNNNTSTSAVIDFADNTLFGGTAIDIPGRNQFAQVVLGPAAGFFSYASRLFSWGEYNKIQNLLNMGMDGGYIPLQSTLFAGSGANSGSGTAWTNPSNAGSLSSYADVNEAASSTSQFLQAETFGFSVTGTPSTITVTFQYYWTGSVGLTLPSIRVQLLKTGAAFGNISTVFLSAFIPGSSGSPLTANITFPAAGLAASDINAATFGVQFSVQGGSSGAHVFLRAAGIGATLIPPFPAGWSTTGTTNSGLLIPTTIAGFAYQLISAGTSLDGLITQPAFQDINGIAIIQPNTTYIARMQVNVPNGTTGTLTVDLYSPTSGQLAAANINLATVTTGSHFIQQAMNASTPATVPTDTILRVYLNAATNAAVITLDELELLYSVKPYLDNVMRGSYVNAPEQFDGVTGTLGPSSDSTPLRCLFEFREVMYMDTAKGRHATSDNGTGEPSTWNVGELSQSVGALSLKSSDTGEVGTGDSGEQFEFTASRSGAYIFWGGEMVKISQEIQTLWDSINFNVKQTVWIKNDPVTRRCYFGVPLGTATAPNVILVLDYRELNTPEAIASTAPFRQSYTGRMIASEICRKWTRWNIASNSAEILTLPNSNQQFTLGAGNGETPGTANGFGNIYYLDPNKLTDDDYGQIVPYWTTYFFVSNDQEQALQLDSHRKLATYFTAFLSGVGQTSITPLSDTIANAYPALPSYPLSASQSHDLEWGMNVDGERIAMQIGSIPASGQTDNSFNLQKLAITLKKHPWSFLRGAL